MRRLLPFALLAALLAGCGPNPPAPSTDPNDRSDPQVKVREAAARMTSSNNLRQIAIAMHNYHDNLGTLPPAAICDKSGKKLLSWRVALLPYLEQEALYRQFKLDEPWDSAHNKPLSATVVKVYTDPRMESKASPGETYYKVFVGKNCAFQWDKGSSLVRITDGTSNTVMVVAAGDPVVWTKPDDIECDPLDTKTPLPDLSKPFDKLLVALCDGSVRGLDLRAMKDADAKLRAAISANGGETLWLDD